MTSEGDASVKCPGCGAACTLPDRTEAAMRIHCRGCDRRFDVVRGPLEDGPYRGQWGFEVRETSPAPIGMTDLSGHPWLRRIAISNRPDRAVTIVLLICVVVGSVIMTLALVASGLPLARAWPVALLGTIGVTVIVAASFLAVDEIGIRDRDLVWTRRLGRLRTRNKSVRASYIQEMRVVTYIGEGSGIGGLAAYTSLGPHWNGMVRRAEQSPGEMIWLSEHIMSGIQLDKLKDEELEPGTSPAPGRPRRRSGRRR